MVSVVKTRRLYILALWEVPVFYLSPAFSVFLDFLIVGFLTGCEAMYLFIVLVYFL